MKKTLLIKQEKFLRWILAMNKLDDFQTILVRRFLAAGEYEIDDGSIEEFLNNIRKKFGSEYIKHSKNIERLKDMGQRDTDKYTQMTTQSLEGQQWNERTY